MIKNQATLSPTKSLGVALLFVLFALAPSVVRAQALASTTVSGLRIELIDLNNSDTLTPQLGRLSEGTRGMSLTATNWANYQEPTFFTQTAAGLFSPGTAAISNSNAAAGLSISGNIFGSSGANIQTYANAYGAPPEAFVLGTRVVSVQDNLSAPLQGLRVTPFTKIVLSGEASFSGSITNTPYPYTQQADSLVLITFGRPGTVPTSFSAGVAVEHPVNAGGSAASYSERRPFSLIFENATPDYVDDLVLQFTVQSFAKSNLVSPVPEPPMSWMFLTATGLFALVMKRRPRTSRRIRS